MKTAITQTVRNKCLLCARARSNSCAHISRANAPVAFASFSRTTGIKARRHPEDRDSGRPTVTPDISTV